MNQSPNSKVVCPVIVVLSASGWSTAESLAAALPDAVIHGYEPRLPGAPFTFPNVVAHVQKLYRAGHPIVGVLASAILIRAVAGVLNDKMAEPPLIAVAEDGSSVVPLLGGHRGANAIAEKIASALSVRASITTASDIRLGVALDQPPSGWILANPEHVKSVTSLLLSGATAQIDPGLDWLGTANIYRSADPGVRLLAGIETQSGDSRTLIYHPKRVVIGVGSDRGCPAQELIELVGSVLEEQCIASAAVSCVVSLERKADEAAVHRLADHMKAPARFLPIDAIEAVANLIPNPSTVVMREVGIPGVAEGAALAASGASKLRAEKTKSARATCAIAVSDQIIDPKEVGRARGRLSVVGIGPGGPNWRSGEALALLAAADDWVGYDLYLDLIGDLKTDQIVHSFPLGAEEARVLHALELAGSGRDVALVCSGDAGIYAMAALVFELCALEGVESKLSDGARRCEIVVAPGISAIQAAAARLGAPIGHDFCCISLSDLLTPWSVIEQRVSAAASGDFVVAFYNPRSRRRTDQLTRSIAILAAHRPATTPVIVATRLGRPGEHLTVSTLADFDPTVVDMLSLVLVGASTTEQWRGGDGRNWVFTPRGYAVKRQIGDKLETVAKRETAK
ncbi:MAG: precorrin-3B C(17)-methyltransferase [Hyphomicrobiaceae bacterium]